MLHSTPETKTGGIVGAGKNWITRQTPNRLLLATDPIPTDPALRAGGVPENVSSHGAEPLRITATL
jgi:hypothetical protein